MQQDNRTRWRGKGGVTSDDLGVHLPFPPLSPAGTCWYKTQRRTALPRNGSQSELILITTYYTHYHMYASDGGIWAPAYTVTDAGSAQDISLVRPTLSFHHFTSSTPDLLYTERPMQASIIYRASYNKYLPQGDKTAVRSPLLLKRSDPISSFFFCTHLGYIHTSGIFCILAKTTQNTCQYSTPYFAHSTV